jgi:hypothetical protein
MDTIDRYRSEVEKFIGRIDWKSRTARLHLGVMGLWFIYVVLLLTTPFTPSPQLDITRQTLRLLEVFIALMYLAAWQAAIYAYNRLANYSAAIKNSKESKGFRMLASSILILVVSLIAATFVSSINSHLAASGHRSSFLVILTNYLYVFPFLYAFWSFWTGSRYLASKVRSGVSPIAVIVLCSILVIFMYFWLDSIFTNMLRTASADPRIPATYYLKDSLIVLTIVIPSFLAWLLSIGTILNLDNYTRRVEGLIYRRALSALSWGIWAVIASSVFLQGLQSLGTARLIKLGLVKLILIIFALLTLQLLGYALVALGAKRLNKIETV